MSRIKLIHWKIEEIDDKANILQAAGYEVDSSLSLGSQLFRQLGENPPAAIVIDLSRSPSQGRDFALLIRKRKTSRHIPLVFVGGAPQKVDPIKQLIPDASYTSWDEIDLTLVQAIANPPAEPVVHESTFAGYAGKPLPDKLGIKAGMTIVLVHPPQEFAETLGKLPDGTQIQEARTGGFDLTIWFCRSISDLNSNLEHIVAQARSDPVWIAWPKKKSGVRSDLTQQFVRQTGLDNNMVDYKICSIDETWSGLLFKYREKN